MKKSIAMRTGLLLLAALVASGYAGEVAIYTGAESWITDPLAEAQAKICVDRLKAAGITNMWYQLATDDSALADWVEDHTNNGQVDVLVLYGYTPSSIYPAANASPNNSIAELFIESADGDAIINHADWMFYVSSTNNGGAGLQNMMDNTNMTCGNADTPMVVTDEGREIAPTLYDFPSDRPLYVNRVANEWFVEAALAQNADGTQADPVIVRDGTRGRLIPLHQTANQTEAKGAVAAEVIAWLMGVELRATGLALSSSGSATTVTGTPARLKLSLVDGAGIPTRSSAAVTVTLAKSSATGVFETAWKGKYDGTVTSVTIPAGTTSVTLYYRDTTAGTVTLSTTAPSLTDGGLELTVLQDTPTPPGEVVIYTGAVNWIDKVSADAQAQLCVNKLNTLVIPNTWYSSTADNTTLATWMTQATGNGEKDVLILYGFFPSSIYPAANASPNNSIAEKFIESTDGDAIINHGDWMFYYNSAGNNGVGGLQNMMDLPTIELWDDYNVPMAVTDQGAAIAPSLSAYLDDRPFPLEQITGEWFVEAALAEFANGTRMDPCVVRDGNRGRLIPVYHTNAQADPKGAVAAEIIAWLYGVDPGAPTQVGFKSGTIAENRTVAFPGQPMKLTVQIQNKIGSPYVVSTATVVNLTMSATTTGAFDLTANGSFNGTVKSVTVAAGQTSADFYYKDTAAGTPTLTGSSTGLTAGTIGLTIFPRYSFAPAGDVAVYTGAVNWITAVEAATEAKVCVDRLRGAGIPTTWFDNTASDNDLATWVFDHTDNDKLDVLVLYGFFPTSIYPFGNTSPNNSIAELFIESTDGDTIINHGDWMFYYNTAGNNGAAGLQNMMDVPGVSLGDANTPMVVTSEGTAIAPSLRNFPCDRPFFLDTAAHTALAGNWLLEVSLAQTADGMQMDPCVLRDGDRGRLIPVYQTQNQYNEAKGRVAAEIIAWLMGKKVVWLSGSTTTVAGTPVRLTVNLQNVTGTPIPSATPVTVNLTATPATGAFDTAWEGSYDGTVTSVTVPAGATTATVYYRNASAGLVTLSAAAAGLASGQLDLNVVEAAAVSKGQVAIYTGATWWLDKTLADAQAQICVDALNELEIANAWFANTTDETALAEWVVDATENGKQDVLVLYGRLPNSLYAPGNTQPNDSLAELFIDSPDGDAILNHGDWLFYKSSTDATNNGAGGLQNMMDLPTITLTGLDNTPMVLTDQAPLIAPTLTDFASDRPIPIAQLAGEWFVEATLAQNAVGSMAEPCVLRDGNRGRLIPVFHTYIEDNPKGAVAAEIIAWLMEKATEVEPPPNIYVMMGNVNTDTQVNIADAVALLGYLFAKKAEPVCAKAADANDDDQINIADAVAILGFLFSQKPMYAPDHSEVKGSSKCVGYAADGNDGKPFFPAQITGMAPCVTQCTPTPP